MNNLNDCIPANTIETLARNFFKQASNYGFRQEDYLKFVNVLLEVAMQRNGLSATIDKVQNSVTEYCNSAINFRELPLHGERVEIRAFSTKEDRALLDDWLHDDFGRYFLISRTTAKELNVDRLIKNDYNILGVVLHHRNPIGIVAFLDHDPIQHKAELRKLIGQPSMRGRGLAKEATRLWLQYGITGHLDLKKIYLNTLNTHIRNIRLNEELGFRVEGILRNETLIDGKYYDVLRMGLCV